MIYMIHKDMIQCDVYCMFILSLMHKIQRLGLSYPSSTLIFCTRFLAYFTSLKTS